MAKTVTPGGSPPAVPGVARTAGHLTVLFSQKILAVRKAMTYTDLLATVKLSFQICQGLHLNHLILLEHLIFAIEHLLLMEVYSFLTLTNSKMHHSDKEY